MVAPRHPRSLNAGHAWWAPVVLLSTGLTVGWAGCSSRSSTAPDAGADGAAGGNHVGAGGSRGGGAGAGGAGTAGRTNAGGTGGGGAGAGGGSVGTGGRSDMGGAGATGGTGGRSDTGGAGMATAGRGGMGGGQATGGQGGRSCAFASMYSIADAGGLSNTLNTVTLTPPSIFLYERRIFFPDAGNLSCAPALPGCGTASRTDVSDVEAALAHPDVQAALSFAVPPVYGDRMIADGPSFLFRRADGRGFVAGYPCNVPSASCSPVPAGVSALVEVLRTLIREELAEPACDALDP
jgi:hypothetical protein